MIQNLSISSLPVGNSTPRPCSKKQPQRSNPERSYCTCCEGKFYRNDLVEVYYKLLKKSAFHCKKCMSANADNLQFNSREKNQYLIELFSGSKTVSNTANSFGFKTFNVDFIEKYNPDLVADISKLSLKQIPNSNKAFIVWASLPCTYYSILNISNHWEKLTYSFRKYYYIPKNKRGTAGNPVIRKNFVANQKDKSGLLFHRKSKRRFTAHASAWCSSFSSFYLLQRLWI